MTIANTKTNVFRGVGNTLATATGTGVPVLTYIDGVLSILLVGADNAPLRGADGAPLYGVY